MERLVEVRLRHRDVVLDPPREGAPGLVDDAEDAVAGRDRVDEDAERQDVVELVERDLLPGELLADRPGPLDAPRHLGLEARRPDLLEELAPDLLDGRRRRLQPLVHRAVQGGPLVGVEETEGEVLELPLHLAHAEPVRERRVDLHRLGGDRPPLLVREMLERPHVVEPVRELDEDDPEVVGHREEHLAERLRLLGLARREGVAADLRDPVDEVRDVRPEQLPEPLLRHLGVLEDVVEKSRCDRDLVEPHLREDHRDVQRVDEVRLARGPELVPMGVRRDDVRPAEQLLVHLRVVALHFLEDVFEPRHGSHYPGSGAFRLISGGRGPDGSREAAGGPVSAPRQAPRRDPPGIRDRHLPDPLPDRLPRDGARRDAIPPGRLAPLRGGDVRGARLALAVGPLRAPLRGRRPRRHRELLDREEDRPEGVHRLRSLPEAGAPPEDRGVLREARPEDDHPRPLRADHPDLRPVRRGRRVDELPRLPRLQRHRRRGVGRALRLRRVLLREHPGRRGRTSRSSSSPSS